MKLITVNGHNYQVNEEEFEHYQHTGELPDDVKAMSEGKVDTRDVEVPREVVTGIAAVGGPEAVVVRRSCGCLGPVGDPHRIGCRYHISGSSEDDAVAAPDSPFVVRPLVDPTPGKQPGDFQPPRRKQRSIPHRPASDVTPEGTSECQHDVVMLIRMETFGRPERDLSVVQNVARVLYRSYGDSVHIETKDGEFNLGSEGRLIPAEVVVKESGDLPENPVLPPVLVRSGPFVWDGEAVRIRPVVEESDDTAKE